MFEWVFVLAVIVLPGWLSVTASRLYYPLTSDKSAVMQWGTLVYHASVSHVIISGLFALIVFGLSYCVSIPLPFDNILSNGKIDFEAEFSMWLFLTTGCYAIVMIFGSTLLGVTNIPSRITNRIAKSSSYFSPDRKMLPDEPLFYQAWELSRRELGDNTTVQVRAQMKNGDLYVGQLYRYEFVIDIDGSRDIMLVDPIVLFPKGDADKMMEFDFSDSSDETIGGGVLLNTENISSIVYEYYTENERQS